MASSFIEKIEKNPGFFSVEKMPIEYFDFFSVQAKRLELERKFLRQIIQN
jgi:hypothetical protein